MITNTYLLECLLKKAEKSDFACILWGNGFDDVYGKLSCLAGFGVDQKFENLGEVDLNSVVPLMGYISYDYKNTIEPMLKSSHPPMGSFRDVVFVQPKEWISVDREGREEGSADLLGEISRNLAQGLEGGFLDVALPGGSGSESVDYLDQSVESSKLNQSLLNMSKVDWKEKTSELEYLKQIEIIKAHIVEGDFYEMNHCIAFSADAELNPYETFLALNTKAPAPFACFVKDGDRYLLSSSPERFVAARNGDLISQPIKGTRKRVTAAPDDGLTDQQVALSLKNSEKDRAENVMIVDLVRNDMSRVCLPGSVVVPELCEVYSYSHVHQLVSTVKGRLKPNVNFKDIVHATFPMGSMTGAPKIAVMQHTESLENFSRGIYSGTVGYVWRGDFDLNVVIRSLMYEKSKRELNYAVGGAITYDSIGKDEYQECLDKAATVLSIFGD